MNKFRLLTIFRKADVFYTKNYCRWNNRIYFSNQKNSIFETRKTFPHIYVQKYGVKFYPIFCNLFCVNIQHKVIFLSKKFKFAVILNNCGIKLDYNQIFAAEEWFWKSAVPLHCDYDVLLWTHPLLKENCRTYQWQKLFERRACLSIDILYVD